MKNNNNNNNKEGALQPFTRAQLGTLERYRYLNKLQEQKWRQKHGWNKENEWINKT